VTWQNGDSKEPRVILLASTLQPFLVQRTSIYIRRHTKINQMFLRRLHSGDVSQGDPRKNM
jgi:hypothetical protein